jgi:hypothetical protein
MTFREKEQQENLRANLNRIHSLINQTTFDVHKVKELVKPIAAPLALNKAPSLTRS